jgi:dTMP kinase
MTRPRSRRPARGLFVALEGIDGSGKSTLLAALGRVLRRRGFSVRLRHEPVDRTIGRLAQEAGARDPWTGAVYFTVDRHLAAPRLKADLRRFDVVLSDRSFYSTVAYQGSRLSPRDRARLEQLQRSATVVPDLVLFLDLPASWLGRRITGRAAVRGPLERSRDLARVALAYRRLARRDGWIVLDARRPREVLLEEAVRAVEPHRARRPSSPRGKTLRGPRGPSRTG